MKVMSYNVRLFDLYNWSHNTATRNEILDLIRVEDPDILCLQEFVHADDPIGSSPGTPCWPTCRFTQVHDVLPSTPSAGCTSASPPSAPGPS